jgi:hypothetical protein
MSIKLNIWTTIIGASAISTAATAGTVTVEVELPRISTAEYHRPYAAGWIENAGGAHQANLFLWYDVDMRNNGGAKWLQDLRAWWRKSGRNLTTPIDGVSSATKAPGRQTLSFDSNSPAFKALASGSYVLNVEVSREKGGHELVKVPFTWDARKATAGSAKGSEELGTVKLAYKP